MPFRTCIICLLCTGFLGRPRQAPRPGCEAPRLPGHVRGERTVLAAARWRPLTPEVAFPPRLCRAAHLRNKPRELPRSQRGGKPAGFYGVESERWLESRSIDGGAPFPEHFLDPLWGGMTRHDTTRHDTTRHACRSQTRRAPWVGVCGQEQPQRLPGGHGQGHREPPDASGVCALAALPLISGLLTLSAASDAGQEARHPHGSACACIILRRGKVICCDRRTCFKPLPCPPADPSPPVCITASKIDTKK